MYLFVYWLCVFIAVVMGFLLIGWPAGPPLCCCAQASHCRGFCCETRALGWAGFSSCNLQARRAQVQYLWCPGLVAPWHVASSQTRIGRCPLHRKAEAQPLTARKHLVFLTVSQGIWISVSLPGIKATCPAVEVYGVLTADFQEFPTLPVCLMQIACHVDTPLHTPFGDRHGGNDQLGSEGTVTSWWRWLWPLPTFPQFLLIFHKAAGGRTAGGQRAGWHWRSFLRSMLPWRARGAKDFFEAKVGASFLRGTAPLFLHPDQPRLPSRRPAGQDKGDGPLSTWDGRERRVCLCAIWKLKGNVWWQMLWILVSDLFLFLTVLSPRFLGFSL